MKMLRTFSNIAGRCHTRTMKGWGTAYKWLGMVNHCIAEIHKNENATWPELCQTHKIDSLPIFVKLAEGGHGSKILTPNKKVKVPAGQKQPNPLLGKKFPKKGATPAVGKKCPKCGQMVGCRTKNCGCGHKFY